MSVVLRKRLLIGLFFVLSAIGLAQQSGSGTKLTGQIVDQQSGALQGAAVILLNGAGTVRLQQTSSGQDGMFSFAGLAPGDYVLDVTCASVLTMIGVAYIENGSPLLNNPWLLEREPEQILAMPKWALPARYTIHAVSGDPAANSQTDAGPGGGHLAGLLYGPMLQSVLEDRFQLRIHREVDEVPMYALAVANTGFGLNPMRD